jgi:hypothetical protein
MAAPTLIVGLGGIGSQIAAILSEMVTDEKLRERIKFVVFDTDANDLDKIKRKDPFIRTVQTSTNMTVGDYLHLDEHTRDNSFPINPNLYRKTLSEGAGQVRAISYLALVTAMKRGQLAPLDEAIYSLYPHESGQTKQVLRIIIVSSLAGGTGSGLILPISMYIRHFLKTQIQIPGNITRGFFILPEILYGSVAAVPMRNAFKANSYAVLRELNAFILKADGNLPERYKDKVKLEFPKVGTDKFEEYDVLPMDFCFMFDAQSIEVGKLNSTQQYIKHAATCIYAQSIGPMNTKSNSQEDNVIRTLVSGQSRNRYAGAGASELVYPSNHILEYVALKWASQTVTETWTMFDKVYKNRSRENNRARMKGLPYDASITPGKVYVDTVEDLSKREDPFSIFTRRASFNYDKDGFTERGQKWNAYIDALRENVRSNAEKYQSDIDTAFKNAESAIKELQNNEKERPDMDTFTRAYESLKYYRELVKRRVTDLGRVTAYTLFKYDDGTDVTNTKDVSRIEAYMRDDNQQFMHPNAVRYFLYETIKLIKSKFDENVEKKEKHEKDFERFDKIFDDPSTKDIVETIGTFVTEYSEAGLWDKLTKKYEGKVKNYVIQFEVFLNKIADYRVTAPYVIVLKEAQEYVKNLNESFETFYSSLEANVGDIERRIETAEKKYRNKQGNTIRYVCTSENCLTKFYNEMEFTGNAIELPGELCQKMYNKVREYSKLPDSNKTSNFFKDTFDNEIIKHFINSVEREYGQKIKMDIIQALEVEAKYDKGLQEHSLITEHVKKVIKETKELAAPFINRPVGEEYVPIPACAYNKKLILVDNNSNPDREEFVNEHLKTFGGVECEDEDGISTQRILFYSAIYGLYPYDLLKFTPENKSQTGGPEAGEYYKAYWDMVDRIGPNPLETKVITPHLHKHWHLISEMPDLNDKEQEKHEKKIYKALVLGFLHKWLKYEHTGKPNEKPKYKLFLKSSKSNSETQLQVSNHTTCDTFYEVVDALTINPVIVNDIISAAEEAIQEEHKANIVKFKDGAIYKGIESFKLKEISDDEKRLMSIFDIAMAFKVTIPAAQFIDKQGKMLIEATMEALYEQIYNLCSDNERDLTFCEIISKQFEIFKQNISLYETKQQCGIKDFLRLLLHTVSNFLHKKGYTEVEKLVDEYSDEYFSRNKTSAQKGKTAKMEAENKEE